jgi:hypothetical protein
LDNHDKIKTKMCIVVCTGIGSFQFIVMGKKVRLYNDECFFIGLDFPAFVGVLHQQTYLTWIIDDKIKTKCVL